jgi:prepilin-type N-terminal cleavage/methylation domain-containing protein
MRATVQKNGFSLMEVMVALALLAFSFTSLVLVQSRATSLAIQARSISIGTQLARYQLMECKREAQKIISSASDFKLEGDFTEAGFEKYTWECHAPRFNMRTPSASALESQAKAKAPEGAKDSFGTTSSAVSPMMSLITDSLGNSVRELVVIVRWKDNSVDDEIRVVTHIVDLAAMSALSKMLKQGADSLAKPAAPKSDQASPPPGPGGVAPPRGPPPVGGGFPPNAP